MSVSTIPQRGLNMNTDLSMGMCMGVSVSVSIGVSSRLGPSGGSDAGALLEPAAETEWRRGSGQI